MIAVKDAIAQLDVLLQEYAALSGSSDSQARGRVVTQRLQAAIDRLTIPSSSYAKQADQIKDVVMHRRISALAAIASALRDDLQAGWLQSIVELVHADTYNDFLEMAEGLLDQNYKDAAAVIAGSSLEAHIRALCGKHNVSIDVSGKPKKADTMNADLKKAGAYGALEQKTITAWLDLRNSAAHGKYADYGTKDVEHLIRGIRDFMVKYPA